MNDHVDVLIIGAEASSAGAAWSLAERTMAGCPTNSPAPKLPPMMRG